MIFLQFYALSLLRYPFFPSQKKQSEFKNLSTGTCRSVNLTLRECQNNATSIELLRCCNSLLSRKTRLNNLLKVWIGTFKLAKEYFIENALNFFLGIKSWYTSNAKEVPLFLKKSIFQANFFFNYRFDFTMKVSTDILTLVENDFFAKLLSLIVVSRSW